jgi:hypothetical protein
MHATINLDLEQSKISHYEKQMKQAQPVDHASDRIELLEMLVANLLVSRALHNDMFSHVLNTMEEVRVLIHSAIQVQKQYGPVPASIVEDVQAVNTRLEELTHKLKEMEIQEKQMVVNMIQYGPQVPQHIQMNAQSKSGGWESFFGFLKSPGGVVLIVVLLWVLLLWIGIDPREIMTAAGNWMNPKAE